MFLSEFIGINSFKRKITRLWTLNWVIWAAFKDKHSLFSCWKRLRITTKRNWCGSRKLWNNTHSDAIDVLLFDLVWSGDNVGVCCRDLTPLNGLNCWALIRSVQLLWFLLCRSHSVVRFVYCKWTAVLYFIVCQCCRSTRIVTKHFLRWTEALMSCKSYALSALAASSTPI